MFIIIDMLKLNSVLIDLLYQFGSFVESHCNYKLIFNVKIKKNLNHCYLF